MNIKLSQSRASIIACVFIFILPFFVYWPMWLHPQAMAYDMADYFLPYRYFIGECLQQYQFPWWNPYSGMGVPMGADPQSGVFYPITWLTGYFLGYDFLTINIEYLFHLVIAGLGMFALLRGLKYPVFICLLLAWSYQFCGFFVNNAQHYSWVISAAWLPFIFHFYRKTFLSGNYTDAIKTALTLFMFTTGGYPAFLIILLYLIGSHYLFFLIRNLQQQNKKHIFQMLRWSVAMLVIYLVISAPYIFSFLQGIPLMTRGDALIKEQTAFRAFTPQSAVTFLLPSVPLGRNLDFDTDISMANAYIGLFALIYFLTGIILTRKILIRIVAFLSMVFLFIAFGDAIPVWPYLFDYLPFFDHIRFPAAFRLFVIIGFIIVAAEGWKGEQLRASKLPIFVAFALIMLVIVLSGVAWYYNSNFILPSSFSTAAFLKFFGESSTANNIILQSFLQLALLVALLLLFITKNKWQSTPWYFFVTTVAITDLFIASGINFTTIMSSPFSATALNQKIAQSPHGFPLWNPATELETTSIGNGSFAPSYFNNNLFTKQFSRDNYSPFVLKLRGELEHSPEKFLLMDHPVVYLANKVQSFSTGPSDSAHVKHRQTVLVPESIFPDKFKSAPVDSLVYTIQLSSFATNEFAFNVNTNQPALLILQQTFYPGWKIKVDGSATDILIVNFCMMSVLLPAGTHKVEFHFDTSLTGWLLLISTCVLLFLSVFLCLIRMKILQRGFRK